ncbi:MAG: HNH endonuclease [Rhizobium sp.]|nr:HNH endonuclease [Rhizobium sp.]
MTVDTRFALIDQDGDYRYPYKKSDLTTKRYGFALGRDRNGEGEYTEDLEQVIRAVVFEGKSVRVKTQDGNLGKSGNSLTLHARKRIMGYWIAPELLHLVTGATIRPINEGVTSPAGEVPGAPDAFDRVSALSAADYIEAYASISERITPNQQAMLLGHAAAQGHTLSMEAIASIGGYENYKSANTQYGRLGRLFAEHFGIDGLGNQTQALATAGRSDPKGHWQWTLRPALVEALENLGLIEGKVEAPGLMEAALDVNSDPKNKDIPETTKQALINARIGQGGYRKRMLRLWEGKCALTGCSVETVLVASHAKPWAEASNPERLDEYNGLLLAASIDRLFDAGLISFSDEGSILLSSVLEPDDVRSLGVSLESKLRLVAEQHKPYLKAHREQHGFDKR